MVDPTDIPADALSSLSSEYAPYFTDSCSMPTFYSPTGTLPVPSSTVTPIAGGSGSGSGSNNWAGCVPFQWYFGGLVIGQGYSCDDGLHYVSTY